VRHFGSDVRFANEDTFFHYKVIGIIIEDGHLLAVTNDDVDYYYAVGGAVRFGEKSCDAVLREVLEETGIRYEVDRLVFVYEKTFKDKNINGGSLAHEVALCYLMKSKGEKFEVTAESYGMYGDKEKFCWLPIDRLGEYKIFPEFFVDKLKDIPSCIEHIVQIDMN